MKNKIIITMTLTVTSMLLLTSCDNEKSAKESCMYEDLEKVRDFVRYEQAIRNAKTASNNLAKTWRTPTMFQHSVEYEKETSLSSLDIEIIKSRHLRSCMKRKGYWQE